MLSRSLLLAGAVFCAGLSGAQAHAFLDTADPSVGATVTVTNNQTGAVREVMSGSDGSATVPALSLTGTYTVAVSKQGFGIEERSDVALRAGETATLRVKLLVGAEKSEVTWTRSTRSTTLRS